MDNVGKTLQNHWPKIALGVAAIALLGYGIYASSEKQQVASKPQSRQQRGKIQIQPKELTEKQAKQRDLLKRSKTSQLEPWPDPAEVIDNKASHEEAVKQVAAWQANVLVPYIRKYPPKVEEKTSTIYQCDFMQVYDYIEGIARVHLRKIRDQHEESRQDLFTKCFINTQSLSKDQQQALYGDYFQQVCDDMAKELENYQEMSQMVNEACGINQIVFDQSLDKWLQEHEMSIRMTLRANTSSMFKFPGPQNADQVLALYKEANDFALFRIKSADHLLRVIPNQDEMPLIMLDYIICDYVRHHHQMSSTMLKSAISSFRLQDHDKMEIEVSKVVGALK